MTFKKGHKLGFKKGNTMGIKFPKGNKISVGNKGNRDNPNVVTYKPEYAQMMIDYFEKSPHLKEVRKGWAKEYNRDGTTKKESENTDLMPNRMPSFLGFARSINTWPQQLLDWCRYEEFRLTYNKCKEFQKEWLVNVGLSGYTPATSFMFVAKNFTDMKDKQDIDITSGGEKLGVIELPRREK